MLENWAGILSTVVQVLMTAVLVVVSCSGAIWCLGKMSQVTGPIFYSDSKDTIIFHESTDSFLNLEWLNQLNRNKIKKLGTKITRIIDQFYL